MSIGLDDETADDELYQWYQSEDFELDEMCSKYRELQAVQKLHESVIKELEEPMKALAVKIQAKMQGYKKVRTQAGYTCQWVPFKRKGYTVAATEGERWQLRSPF